MNTNAGPVLPERLYVMLIGGMQPFPIYTTIGGGADGNGPLKTIADLIIAAKKMFAPDLDDFSPVNITIHTSISGTESDVFLQPCLELIDLPQESGVVVGSDYRHPLFIKTHAPSRRPPSPPIVTNYATFEFLELIASRKLVDTLKLSLYDGRIDVDLVLKKIGSGASALKQIQGENMVTVMKRKVGFSVMQFMPNQTHQLYVLRDCRKIGVTFSDAKLRIETVYEDFGIDLDDVESNLDHEVCQRWSAIQAPQPPDALLKTLDLFIKFSTKRPESSRRFIVSTMIFYALEVVEVGKCMLSLDEGTPLSYGVPRRDPKGDSIIADYHGPADFVVGHSQNLGKMSQDASLLILEVKKTETFHHAEAQALAQAAVCMSSRWIGRRGRHHTGGPVFYIMTDGYTWIFSKLEQDDFGLHSTKTGQLDLNKVKDDTGMIRFDRGDITRLFNWLVYILEKSRDSSPRASTRSAPPNPNLPLVAEITTQIAQTTLSSNK